MIAVIDYGVGNLFSLVQSLKKVGAECDVTADKSRILAAEEIILPGVGAFGDAIKKLRDSGLDKVIVSECNKGKPLLGICLGMQLLLDKSFEYGEHRGLGLIEGEVVPLSDYVKGLKVPHMGWNSLNIQKKNRLFDGVEQGDYVYFVHSYFAKCANSVVATANYGIDVTAAINKGNIFGVQFHPEKSGTVGLEILKSFCKL